MAGWEYNANGDVVTPVEIYGSNIMQPVEIQGHLQTAIQTHNAVSVGPTNGTASSAWMDTNGYDQVALTLMNDAGVSSSGTLQWSYDGTNIHGEETVLAAGGTARYRTASTDTKARYVRVILTNPDAAAHTMSAWLYLKA